MTWLWAQTLILLTLAYLIGAAVACFFRRALSAGQMTVPAHRRGAAAAAGAQPGLRRVDPLPEVDQSRGLAARYERSLEGDRREPARPPPPPPVAPPMRPP